MVPTCCRRGWPTWSSIRRRRSERHRGGCVVDVPLGEGWSLDADRFEDAIDDHTKVVIFSQPHNPSGRVFTNDELVAFTSVAELHDLIVVSNEIWADLTHDHLPIVVADQRLLERRVTIGSASKAFNISGLRCAVAHIGPARIRRELAALPKQLPGGPSTLSAAATVAAWTYGEDWLDDTKASLTARRGHLAARLKADAPEVGFDPPEATYLAWLDLRKTNLGDDPAARLLDDARVALSSGPAFGSQGVGCARLNFATSEAILDMILDRVIDAIRAERKGTP